MINNDKVPANQQYKRVQRFIQLIERILYESEESGNCNLLSHEALLKGEKYNFTIENKLGNTTNAVSLKLKMFSNKTIYELREYIAQMLNTEVDKFKISLIAGEEILNNCNGMTLKRKNLQTG
jgi:hypothetical protein